jgi:predicted ArsR family transcriptional regulator
MASGHWDKRFYAGTRGRIVALLRRSSRSVDELAQALDLTGNAIRAHLIVLERDGFVLQQSVRRGVGKPTFVYKLTPQAEHLFSKAYEPVLDSLIDVLAERTDGAELEDLLRAVGRRIASGQAVPHNGARARVEAAIALINEMGGLIELEETDGKLALCGYSCPLSALVQKHPELCKLVESILVELTGLPVRERCERGESLSCRFELPMPARDTLRPG